MRSEPFLENLVRNSREMKTLNGLNKNESDPVALFNFFRVRRALYFYVSTPIAEALALLYALLSKPRAALSNGTTSRAFSRSYGRTSRASFVPGMT